MAGKSQFIPQETGDGSYTFFSPDFQESFHSAHGAYQEAEVRYIQPCLIREMAAQQSQIKILDVCYGLGYNSAAALAAIWEVNPQCQVELFALELAPEVPHSAIQHDLLHHWPAPVPELLKELALASQVNIPQLQAQILWGDARQTIDLLLNQQWQAEAIFFDPFSPPKCPQLWTLEFINRVVKILASSGRLATYSCAAAVRTALSNAGLTIGSITGAGRKSPGTIAAREYHKLPRLSSQEQEHLLTRAAIPYRDPTLANSPEQILQARQQEQQKSHLEPTSQWRKRWLKSSL